MRAILVPRLVAPMLAAHALLGCSGSSSAGAGAAADASTDTGPALDACACVDGAQDAGPSPDGPASGDASSADGGTGAAFCDATYGELRVAFEGCCTSGDTTTNQYKFVDAIYAAVDSDCASALESAIAKGRVAFDTTAATTCEASFQQRVAQGNCWGDVFTNQPGPPIFGASACSGVVTGQQGAGAPCAVDFECKDGLTCIGWGATTDGACGTPGGAGSRCGPAADAGSPLDLPWGFGNHPRCAAGAYCKGSTCAAQGASGAACSADSACEGPLICHLGACAAATISADGGACDAKIDCQPGLYCAPGDGGALPGACQPRVPLGGHCTANGDECKGLCVVPDGGTAGVCAALCGSG